jgi:HEAT repeat protein
MGASLLGLIWWGSLTLALLSVLGMLILVVRRFFLMRNERRSAVWRDAIMLGVVGWLDGDEDLASIERAVKGRAAVAADLIAELRQVVRGQQRERLAALADALGIVEFNRRRLITGDTRTRRLVAARLAIGPAEHVALSLEAALDDPDYQVRLAAARSLAELRAIRSVRLLVDKLGLAAEHNSRVLYYIFRQLVPALNDQLVALLQSECSAVIKELALDALGHSGDGAMVEPISRLLNDSSPEVRAKALRALTDLGYPEAGPRALRALADPAWWVRTQAAICVGRVGFLPALPLLAELLADKQWWVRFRAAEALYALGEKGRALLKAAAEATGGRAARVSELLLAEKERMV